MTEAAVASELIRSFGRFNTHPSAKTVIISDARTADACHPVAAT